MDRLKLQKTAALSLILGLALVALPVAAGNDSWSVTGQPYGGTVGKIVVDPATPTTFYAVSNQLIFKSTDSGSTWTQIFAASSPTLTGDISLDPQAPGAIYVAFGFFGGGPGVISGDQGVFVNDPGDIYKSTDGGATWTQIDDGIGLYTYAGTFGVGTPITDTVCRVAVDPLHEGVAYAGGCSTGMYKTTDGGATWIPINKGLTPVTAPAHSVVSIVVGNIVVDPVTPNVVYVESDEGIADPSTGWYGTPHLYKSTDGGKTWNALSVATWGFDADVAIDPTDNTHLLFCGVGYGGAANSWMSTDSGATWSAAGCPDDVVSLAFDPVDPTHVIAVSSDFLPDDVYESTDGGATFTTETNLPPNGSMSFGSVLFDPNTPGDVYLGMADWGVLKSSDDGATWNATNTGLTGVHAGQMLEGSDGIFYMATGNAGILKSLDQGATWAEVGSGPAGSLPYQADGFALSALAQNPTTPTTLYAGSWAGFDISTDGGNTWNPSMTGMASYSPVSAIELDPEVPATLYAGVNYSSGSNWVGGLFKSVDGGATWTESDSGLGLSYATVKGITVDPHNSAVVFAADGYDGVYKSADGGATWSVSKDGEGNKEFYAVAVDPTDSNTVYASSLTGFYKSSDGGATWMESDTGMTTLGSQINGIIQIDPANTSIIYTSPKYGYGQTYVSSDAGATWFPLTTGLTTSASSSARYATQSTHPTHTGRSTQAMASAGQVTIGAVMLDPKNPTRIYGGGSDGHVYQYDDLHPPTGSGSTGTGSQATAGSSGGGGVFSWLSGLALLLVFARRRLTQRL